MLTRERYIWLRLLCEGAHRVACQRRATECKARLRYVMTKVMRHEQVGGHDILATRRKVGNEHHARPPLAITACLMSLKYV